MGVYKNHSGVLTPIAGRGKAEYGASTLRKGTLTIPVNQATGGIFIEFDTPLPDNDYIVSWEFDDCADGDAAHLVGPHYKYATGFGLYYFGGFTKDVIIRWTAFKLYTDNEYNSIKDSVSDNPDYTRNLLVHPLPLNQLGINLNVAGFDDSLDCSQYNDGPIFIRYASGESTEDAYVPVVPMDRSQTIKNNMLFKVGEEYVFSVQPEYYNPIALPSDPIDFSQYFDLKVRYRTGATTEVDIPLTRVESDRSDQYAVRFTVPSEAATYYGYLNPHDADRALYPYDDSVYLSLYFVIKSGFDFDSMYATAGCPSTWMEEDGILAKFMIQKAPPIGIPVDLTYRGYISTPEDQFYFRNHIITATDWGGAKFHFFKIGRIVYVALGNVPLATPSTLPSSAVTIGTIPHDFKPLINTGFKIINMDPRMDPAFQVTMRITTTGDVTLFADSGYGGQAFASDEQLGSYVCAR